MEMADSVLCDRHDASNPPAAVDDGHFADVEIGKSYKSPAHNNNNNDNDNSINNSINQEKIVIEEEGDWKGEEIGETEVEEGRTGGILHPNERLPRPEPPPGVVLRNDDVAETQAPGAIDSGKDGILAIGRFIRQRSSAFARRLALTEIEEWGGNGNGKGGVVTELKLAGMKVIVQEKKASAINALRGRVTFFSRSNCRDCGAVRSFCRENGLSYVEINLDVYPMREIEVVERTGGTTVPKIFFNATLIGGLVELNALRRSGGGAELEDKLKELLGGKCPESDPAVPPPPVYGVDDDEEERTDKMIGIVRILKQRLPIQDRLIRMRLVSNSFTASDLVELLEKHLGCRRLLAVELGKDLVRKHFIHPVFGDHKFEYGNNVYRFLDHEPYISKCYNFRGSTDEMEPKHASDISQTLSKIMSAILESYASEDRRFVDYTSISNSEEFRRYLNLVHGLQRVDISSLPPNEKLAFFLNLYNAMVIHAVIRLGHPQGFMDKKSMINDFQYLVGGQPYSLSAIKNGVLRSNRRPPYSLTKPFASGDKRLQVALSSVNPLIHFGLCDATRSDPTVRFFTPENVEAELKASTRDFFSNGGIEVDLAKRTVHLTTIIKWFSADFGNDKEILKWVLNYLDSSNAGLLTHLLGDWGNVNLVYQSYDWSLNL